MKLIDLHCDTIWKLMDLDRKGDLMENGCSINIPAMRQAGTKAQFFACFTYIEEWKERGGYDGAYRHVKEMIHLEIAVFLGMQIYRTNCLKWK